MLKQNSPLTTIVNLTAKDTVTDKLGFVKPPERSGFHSRKDGEHCRKPHLFKMLRTADLSVPSPSRYIYNATLTPKAQGTQSEEETERFF